MVDNLENPDPRPRALVVDDHAGIRAGLKGILASGGFDIVGEASDMAGVEQLADTLGPGDVDVVITDRDLGGEAGPRQGAQVARILRERIGKEVGVVFHSSHEPVDHDEKDSDRVVNIEKPGPPGELLEAAHRIAKRQDGAEELEDPAA